MGSKTLSCVPAVMATTSSDEDDTPRRARVFKRGKRTLNSESEEEERTLTRGYRAAERSIVTKQEEEERSSSSEDETPSRGRFRDRRQKEKPHEGNDTSEMSSDDDSKIERSRRMPRTGNKKKRMTDSSPDSLPSVKTTKETRYIVTRSMKIHDINEDTEESAEDLGDESDTDVKMSKKSHINVISSSSDEDTDASENGIDIEIKTRSFPSRYRRQCAYPTRQDQFIVGETRIIGVLLDGQQSWDGKLFWICAKHYSFTRSPKEVQKPRVKEFIDEEEEEPNTEDEDFIDDGESFEEKRAESVDEDQEDEEDGEHEEDEDESSEEAHSEDSRVEEEDVNSEMKDIVQHLTRQSPKDKINRSKYLDEHSKYQLEIHTETNPGLHLSPEKRYRRNLRTAKFDKGLKEERGLGWKDVEYGISKVVHLLDGTRAKIFPQKTKASKFAQFCALEGCERRFREGTKIIGTMFLHEGRFVLNDKGNLSYICCNHVDAEDLRRRK